MRVVAGSAGGRRLASPAGAATRPTADRVREAMFNALTSMGALEGASVLDLFAGTGALGIEALSRGAARATFVDADPRAVAVVRDNLRRTGVAGATVVRADALAFLRGLRDRRTDPDGAPPDRFDLALLDPPYDFDRWPELLSWLDADVVAVESDRELDLGPTWHRRRVKRYGSTVVCLARRHPPERE